MTTAPNLLELGRDCAAHDRRLFLVVQKVKGGAHRESAHRASHARRLVQEKALGAAIDKMSDWLFDKMDLDRAIQYAARSWTVPPEEPDGGVFVKPPLTKRMLQLVRKRVSVAVDEDLEIIRSWGGERAVVAEEALDSAAWNTVRVLRDANGRPIAVASWRIVGDMMMLDRLASAPGAGNGTAMMTEVTRVAERAGLSLRLISASTAEGFYEKLGMVREKGQGFSWTKEQVANFARNGGYLSPELAAVQEELILGMTGEMWAINGAQMYVQMAMQASQVAGQSALQHLGINKTFAWANPRNMANDMFAVRGSKVIQNLYGEHRAELSRMIMAATDPRYPKTVQQVKAEIKERWPKLKGWQAARIARTETAAVWTATAVNAYAANGIDHFESIVAHGPQIDTATGAVGACDHCVWQSTVQFGIHENLPPWHPHCRCEAVPILQDDYGNPWLPPDEPWTGGGPPFPPQSKIDHLMPAPKPDEAFGGESVRFEMMPNNLMREQLKADVKAWPPVIGTSPTVGLKTRAMEIIDSGPIMWSEDAAGKVMAVASWQAMPTEYRILDMSSIGGNRKLVIALGQKAFKDGRDLSIMTDNISSGLMNQLESWGFKKGTEHFWYMKNAELKTTFKVDDVAVIPEAPPQVPGVGLAQLKAELKSTQNKISGMKTRLKKEQALAGGGMPWKVQEIQGKLDDLLAHRAEVKAKITGWTGDPGPPLAPGDIKVTPKMMRDPDEMHRYFDAKKIPDDQIFWTDKHSMFFSSEGNYIPSLDIAVFRHKGIIVKMEVRRGMGEAETLQKEAIKVLDDMLGLKGQEKFKQMSFMQGESPDNAYWERVYKSKGFQAAAQGGHGEIWFWDFRAGKSLTNSHSSFDHELGHVIGNQSGPIDMIKWQAAQQDDILYAATIPPRLRGAGTDAVPGRIGVTNYGSNNEKEDWAESVRLYIKDYKTGRIDVTRVGVRDLGFRDMFPNRAKLLDEWLGLPKKQTPLEWASEWYHSPKSFELNDALRTGKALDMLDVKMNDVVKILDENMTGLEINTELWRGIVDPSKLGVKNVDDLMGRVIEDRGYMSTSLEASMADDFGFGISGVGDVPFLLRINAKAGTKHVDIPAGEYGDQAEFLLGRGTFLHVTKIEKTGVAGRPIVHADVVTAEEAKVLQEAARLEVARLRYIEAGLGDRAMIPGGLVKETGTKKMQTLIQDAINRVGRDGLKRDLARTLATRMRHLDETSPLDQKLNFDNLRDKWDFSRNAYGAEGDESLVSQLIHSWAMSSSDADARGVAMQMAAAREFGLPVKAFAASHVKRPELDAEITAKAELLLSDPTIEHALRTFARAQWEETQAFLKAQGIDEITVYRGMQGLEPGKPWDVGISTGLVTDNPIASWSVKHSESRKFYGGTMLRGSVPREMIFSTPFSGFGCAGEWEVVIMNSGRNRVWVSQEGRRELTAARKVELVAERDALQAEMLTIDREVERLNKIRLEFKDAEYRSLDHMKAINASNEMQAKIGRKYELQSREVDVRSILANESETWRYERETELRKAIDTILRRDPELAGKPLKATRTKGERKSAELTPTKQAYNRITSTRARLKKAQNELAENQGWLLLQEPMQPPGLRALLAKQEAKVTELEGKLAQYQDDYERIKLEGDVAQTTTKKGVEWNSAVELDEEGEAALAAIKSEVATWTSSREEAEAIISSLTGNVEYASEVGASIIVARGANGQIRALAGVENILDEGGTNIWRISGIAGSEAEQQTLVRAVAAKTIEGQSSDAMMYVDLEVGTGMATAEGAAALTKTLAEWGFVQDSYDTYRWIIAGAKLNKFGADSFALKSKVAVKGITYEKGTIEGGEVWNVINSAGDDMAVINIASVASGPKYKANYQGKEYGTDDLDDAKAWIEGQDAGVNVKTSTTATKSEWVEATVDEDAELLFNALKAEHAMGTDGAKLLDDIMEMAAEEAQAVGMRVGAMVVRGSDGKVKGMAGLEYGWDADANELIQLFSAIGDETAVLSLIREAGALAVKANMRLGLDGKLVLKAGKENVEKLGFIPDIALDAEFGLEGMYSSAAMSQLKAMLGKPVLSKDVASEIHFTKPKLSDADLGKDPVWTATIKGEKVGSVFEGPSVIGEFKVWNAEYKGFTAVDDGKHFLTRKEAQDWIREQHALNLDEAVDVVVPVVPTLTDVVMNNPGVTAWAGKVSVFRVGKLDDPGRRGVFFAESSESALKYASGHPGEVVTEYVLEAKNTAIFKSARDAFETLFPGKNFNSTFDYYAHQAGVYESGAIGKIDARIAARLRAKGYDSLIYTIPAPPAKYEFAIISKKPIKNLAVEEAPMPPAPFELELGSFIPSTNTKAAIENYTAKGGPEAKLHQATRAQLDEMDEWVSAGRVSDDTFRGFRFSGDVRKQEWLQPGKEITLSERTSFTLDRERIAGYGSGDHTVLITVEGGTRGREIGAWSHYPAEQEVLVPAGARFKVVSAEQRYGDLPNGDRVGMGIWDVRVRGDELPAPPGPKLVPQRFDAERDAPWDAWAKKLTLPEREAIGQYTTSTYSRLNPWLRTGAEPTDPMMATWLRRERKIVPLMDRALKAAPKPDKDLVLWRGVDVRATFGDKLPVVGQEFSDRAFVSTTLVREEAEGWARAAGSKMVLRIEVPRGSEGVGYVPSVIRDLEDFGATAVEREMLLARGSVFEVVGVEDRIITLRLKPGQIADAKPAARTATEAKLQARVDVLEFRVAAEKQRLLDAGYAKNVGSQEGMRLKTRLDRTRDELLRVQERAPAQPMIVQPEIIRAPVYANTKLTASKFKASQVSAEEYTALDSYRSSTWLAEWMRDHSMNWKRPKFEGGGTKAIDLTQPPKEIALIDAVLERSPVKAGVVYRGIRDPSGIADELGMKRMGLSDTEAAPYGFNIQDAVGRTFTERGFMSTTIDRSVAVDNFGPMLMEIRVPAGTKGVFLPKTTGATGESELLLEENLQLLITGAKRSHTGPEIILQVDIVPKSTRPAIPVKPDTIPLTQLVAKPVHQQPAPPMPAAALEPRAVAFDSSEANALLAEAEQLARQAKAGATPESQMLEAISTAARGSSKDELQHVYVLRDADGKLRGAMSTIEHNEVVKISNVGSTIPGGGTALVRIAARAGVARNVPVRLVALGDAKGFYHKLGFTEVKGGPSNYLEMSGKPLERFAYPEPSPTPPMPKPTPEPAVESFPAVERFGAAEDELRRGWKSGIADSDPIYTAGQDAFASKALIDRVTFEDGTKAIVKAVRTPGKPLIPDYTVADAEELGTLVARAVGAKVPDLVRVSDSTVVMGVVDGRKATSKAGYRFGYEKAEEFAQMPDGIRLGVLDVLINNSDRHGLNWFMVQETRESAIRLVGIDHGNAFTWRRYIDGDAKSTTYGKEVMLGPSSGFTHDLLRVSKYNEIRGYKKNPLTRFDAAVLRTRLELLHDDFARLGREDWYREMMLQMDGLEKAAAGKVDIIAGLAPDVPSMAPPMPKLPSALPTPKITLHRTNAKAEGGGTLGRVIDLPKFNVRVNGEHAGEVKAGLVREGGHASGSTKVWYGKRQGPREKSRTFASKKDAMDYVATGRDLGAHIAVEHAIEWRRHGEADWESLDGRFLLHRLVGVRPPAWNVEDLTTGKLLVDGAASRTDAQSLLDDVLRRYPDRLEKTLRKARVWS